MEFWEIWCRGFAPWPLKAAKTDILIPERHLHCIKIHYMALVCIVLHQITEHHITLHWNLQKMMFFAFPIMQPHYNVLHCITLYSNAIYHGLRKLISSYKSCFSRSAPSQSELLSHFSVLLNFEMSRLQYPSSVLLCHCTEGTNSYPYTFTSSISSHTLKIKTFGSNWWINR